LTAIRADNTRPHRLFHERRRTHRPFAVLHRHELFAGAQHHLSTALAANLGLKRALRFCLAVPTGWTLLMLASGLGLGALITGVPALRWAVTLLGVAYMLWLAWKLAAPAR
jgi:threonine/homoserine/homoserine lactone efflux protein